MRRAIPGLHERSGNGTQHIEGVLLTEVERAFYTPHNQKPFFTVRFRVLEPAELAGKTVTGRIYCSERSLWKLRWFLEDFGYDTELLGRDEVDDKGLMGLRGVVKVSHMTFNGRSFTSFDGFASAGRWEELSTSRASA